MAIILPVGNARQKYVPCERGTIQRVTDTIWCLNLVSLRFATRGQRETHEEPNSTPIRERRNGHLNGINQEGSQRRGLEELANSSIREQSDGR
jgi:hypothetical protein